MRLQNLTLGNLTLGGVKLVPGWNTLRGDAAKAVREDAAYAKALKDGRLRLEVPHEVPGAPAEKAAPAKAAKAAKTDKPADAAGAAT